MTKKPDLTATALAVRASGGYCLARTITLFFALFIVVLIVGTGAGTEGQPQLLMSLLVVVSIFVAATGVFALSAWRLQACVDTTTLTVRALRTRSLSLSSITSVQWTPSIVSGPTMILRSKEAGAPRALAIPFGAVTAGFVPIGAWSSADESRLLRAIYEGLPQDVTFDAPAGERFAAAGCSLRSASSQ